MLTCNVRAYLPRYLMQLKSVSNPIKHAALCYAMLVWTALNSNRPVNILQPIRALKSAKRNFTPEISSWDRAYLDQMPCSCRFCPNEQGVANRDITFKFKLAKVSALFFQILVLNFIVLLGKAIHIGQLQFVCGFEAHLTFYFLSKNVHSFLGSVFEFEPIELQWSASKHSCKMKFMPMRSPSRLIHELPTYCVNTFYSIKVI